MLLLCLAWPGAAAFATTPGKVSHGPFAGKPLYVAPNSVAGAEALDPQLSSAQRTKLNWLATIPQATWLTGGSATAAARTVSTVQAAAKKSGTVSQFVIYDIPHRDCGSYSSGGASAAAQYEQYIRSIAAALGSAPAIIVLEPDSLAGASCLTSAQYKQRVALERYAVGHLSYRPRTAVYLDGGNKGWQSAKVMARRLVDAGIVGARGFAVNVSNFDSTQSETSYGVSVSRLVGWKRFVIDTSRNGGGPQGSWCNPGGAAVGSLPGGPTTSNDVDALLWLKHPGESDGQCGAARSTPAGVFDPALALKLISNAGR